VFAAAKRRRAPWNNQRRIVPTISCPSTSEELILSGNMGAQTIIHILDDRRITLLDMTTGESGHKEGIQDAMNLPTPEHSWTQRE